MTNTYLKDNANYCDECDDIHNTETCPGEANMNGAVRQYDSEDAVISTLRLTGFRPDGPWWRNDGGISVKVVRDPYTGKYFVQRRKL